MTNKREDIRENLRRRSFLRVLTDDELDNVISRGHIATFRKGQSVYERGDIGDSLMIIISGRIKIYNVTHDGKEVVLNFLGEGDVNGELAVLDGHSRSADAVVLEQAEVLTIYRRDLIPLLKGNPDSLLGIVEVLCAKVRAMSSMIEHTALNMPGRLAGALLRLALQHGQQTRDGTVIALKLSQRDLGGYAGLSRENANRQLAELRDSALVKFEGARIVISDLARLQDFADANSG